MTRAFLLSLVSFGFSRSNRNSPSRPKVVLGVTQNEKPSPSTAAARTLVWSVAFR